MSDNLTVFGTDFTGVTGIKATGTGNGTLAYIRPQGTKSISANGTGIDVAEYASVDVAVPAPTPSLQSKTKNYTPSETAQSETVTADSGYDGLSSVAVSVGAISSTYVGSGITQRSSSDLTASGDTVTVPAGYYSSQASKAVASGTAGTPTASKGSVSNHSVSITPSVTNTSGYITGSTKTGTAVSVSASELVSGSYAVSASGNHDVTNYATASVAAGGATASATKGSVSNNSITVTPSVTRTAGYVTAGSANGTAVTVSASELVSGSQTITTNNTYDVTNLASVVVNVAGSGGVGTLLNTTSIGTVSTTSTQAASLNISLSVSGVDNYDLLIVESSVNTVTNGRHTATVGVIFLTASSAVGTKNGATIATAKWNSKASSTGTTTTSVSTTAYGVYPNSCTVSSGTATIPMYRRYNSTSTGTMNGTYTARVYGVNLYDLIGG